MSEPMLEVPPSIDTPTHRRWVVHGRALDLHRTRIGWRYERDGLIHGAEVPADTSVVWSLGRGEALALLRRPVVVAPGALELWLRWPLEARLVTRTGEVDAVRPPIRRALLGPPDAGRLLPAAICELVDGPVPCLAEGYAVVRASIVNRTSSNATLRRVPFHEPGLTLAADGDRVVACRVDVRVIDVDHAEAVTAAGDPPPSFAIVHRPPRATPLQPLSWLTEGLRRPDEFRL